MRVNLFKRLTAAGLCALLLCGLFMPAVSEEYRVLRQGMKGEDVLRFKRAMYWLGYFNTEDLDGTYTATTAERVKKSVAPVAGSASLSAASSEPASFSVAV